MDPGPIFLHCLQPFFIGFHHHLLAGHISSSSYFTSTHLILCVWQAGEIDNLSVLLGQSSLLVIMCRSTSIIEKLRYWHLAKPSPSPTSSTTLVLKSRENFRYAASYLPLGVSQQQSAKHFLALLRGTWKLQLGEFHTYFHFTLLLSCLVYFLLVSFCLLFALKLKNTKKKSST